MIAPGVDLDFLDNEVQFGILATVGASPSPIDEQRQSSSSPMIEFHRFRCLC